ncbi:MAG: hypothetical protein P8J87_14140 [Verrucomicrobiales bacterium]|nr:hypothetical protein [Verrucomicrobiales bacterium]
MVTLFVNPGRELLLTIPKGGEIPATDLIFSLVTLRFDLLWLVFIVVL